MKKLILSIDQGTTSSRSILFDLKGKKIFSSQYEFEQIFPNLGWVEHNPEEIWKVTLRTIKEAIKKSKRLKSKIISIGITKILKTIKEPKSILTLLRFAVRHLIIEIRGILGITIILNNKKQLQILKTYF